MAATVNLRAFPLAQDFKCPHCQQTITVYDAEGSQFVVCTACHSYNRFIGTGYLQRQQSVQAIANQPVVPIGTEGTLMGNPYKAIGYIEKKEGHTEYEWREYMLYNYTRGYAFLAEYDGHWSFIAGKGHYPDVANAMETDFKASMDGYGYALYNRYSPVITALTGEYDWDVYEERVATKEFVNPPYLLVEEQNEKDTRIVDWYLGTYLTADDIAEGFNIPVGTFPETVGIGANQVNPHKARWTQSVWISGAAAVLLLLIQLLLVILRPANVIMDKSADLSLPPQPVDTTRHDTTANAALNNYAAINNGNYEFQPLRTSTFSIANGPAPVQVDLEAQVDNNWFEATVELVNEKDNQTWDVSKQIEYYHGYEDGESWSEGSTSASVLLNDVPKGSYHLNVYPYAGTQLLNHINIKVSANVVLWQNILITLLALCLYPLLCWYLYHRFEVNRWMDNYYSPYKKETTND